MSAQPSDNPISWTRFLAGVAVVVVVFAALFGVILGANAGTHRPEGTAEKWLADISDTTRKGIHDDAVKRAEKRGPVAIAEQAGIIPEAAKDDKKRAFADLEVGKATITAETARVPYLLHQYVKSGKAPVRDGTVLLAKQGDKWIVTGMADRNPGEKVPSEGGKPPSSAAGFLWVVAIGIGVVLTVIASLLVNWADRSGKREVVQTATA
jgi:hypothetical protein